VGVREEPETFDTSADEGKRKKKAPILLAGE
jgi:hypothetical protein